MTNERETHFQGYAKLLWDEIRDCLREHHVYLDTIGHWDEAQQAMHVLIAECAYDLAWHVMDALKPSIYLSTFAPDTQDEIFKSIPDLTAWPTEPES